MAKTRTSANDYSNQNKSFKPLSYIKNVAKEGFQLATTGVKTILDADAAQNTPVFPGNGKAPYMGAKPPKNKFPSALGQFGGALIGKKYNDKTGKQTNKGMK
jgi:hypothetical protein